MGGAIYRGAAAHSLSVTRAGPRPDRAASRQPVRAAATTLRRRRVHPQQIFDNAHAPLRWAVPIVAAVSYVDPCPAVHNGPLAMYVPIFGVVFTDT
jgi:hypothetical protein